MRKADYSAQYKQLLFDLVSSIEEFNSKHAKPSELPKMFTKLIICSQKQVSWLSDKHKTELLLRLKVFLRHEEIQVIEKVATILIHLTENFTSLSQDVVVALMVQMEPMLRNSRGNSMSLFCEMLCNLVMCHQENQDLLAVSGCLDSLLECFTMCLNVTSSIELINIVNVLICAACEPFNNINKRQIFNAIVPQVVNYAIQWVEDTESSIETCYVLKECLFLCRKIMSTSEECKEDFLIQENHLKMLIQVLRSQDRMKEHIEIRIGQLTGNLFIDHAPTIFASFVLLLDEAITDSIRMKRRAQEFDVVNILRYYLDIADEEQLAIVITCLVHLIDDAAIIRENKDLVCQMKILYDLNNLSLDRRTMNFLKESWKRKGTPHPKKDHGVAAKRKCVIAPSVTSTIQSEKTTSLNNLNSIPKPNCSMEVGINMSQTFLITNAELMIFFGCILTYGNDMDAVRRAFPFHPAMTPGDLYAMWRAMWKQKMRRM